MIKTIKEIFATTRDLARVIPVTKAKLPDNDDFESMGLILEKTAEKYPDHAMIIFEGKEITLGVSSISKQMLWDVQCWREALNRVTVLQLSWRIGLRCLFQSSHFKRLEL